MRTVRAIVNGEVFYAVYEDRLRRLARAPWEGLEYDGREYTIEQAKLLSPSEPTKLVCIGKNYWAHAEEMKEGHPEEPILFIKPNTSVIADGEDIVYPAISRRVDYEGELALVIGRRASQVVPGSAHEYIFGCTCANDVTARDIQKSEGQWTRGKGFDTFAPLGPWIETDIDPMSTAVTTRLNGEVKQHSETSLMTHDADKLLCYITACMTLLPGDVVLTGTPAGVSPMQRGDTVEVEIDGIGILRNRVI